MKILLVSWTILPQRGGSSIIVENLAKNFKAHEMVVLGSSTFLQRRNWDRPESGPKFFYFFSEIYLFGRGYRYLIWFRKWRFRPLVSKIKSVIKKEKIAYVIGVYPNNFYCLAACRAAKELSIPFSSYFHNTYIENTEIKDSKARVIQDEIFESSEHVFVMSEGMQRYYESTYQMDKFVPLVHTFDKYPEQILATATPPVAKKQYKLVAIGNFNQSNMEATVRLVNALKSTSKYSLDLYTHVPQWMLQQRGLDPEGYHHKGFVNPDAVHGVLQSYDICILTHGFTGGYGEIEYRTIFPTRTIPLLLSGKPILAHSPKGSFLNDFIQKYDCAELVDQADEQAIINGLDNITDNPVRSNRLVQNAMQAAKRFYGPNVAQKLKEILNFNSQTCVE